MDSRIPRLRRKLARIPYIPGRSHSFGEEQHAFRLGPRLPEARADAFEAEHDVELPQPYRDFLISMGGSGASPYYGLIPLDGCTLFTMNRPASPGTSDGSTTWPPDGTTEPWPSPRRVSTRIHRPTAWRRRSDYSSPSLPGR
ncbi:SMI1/KNR4 family protein [Streptomyces virginiae]|uniref:SMI1/KNR4 family protein n=1 Tax=Streptomyces virginiae TaxID=1961 RepID=UPI00371297E4